MVRPDPDKIVIPRKHGQVLVEPDLGRLAAALQERSRVRIEGREKARGAFLEAAREWARVTGGEGPGLDALEKPWAVTGHQLEFYHAGVWAKVLAVDALARRVEGGVGGVAFDLLVDHDLVEQYGFEVPVKVGDQWVRRGVELLGDSPLPVEAVRGPTLEEFEKWDAELADFAATQTDVMAFMLAAWRGAIVRGGLGYTAWMSAGRGAFERSMGLAVHHVPATWACRGAIWEWFVGQWVANAAAWMEVYNRHLGAYRGRQGIKGTQHPMPDLVRGDGVFELPFWVYREGEARERMVIRKTAGGGTRGVVVLHGGREVAFGGSLGGDWGGLRVRPRALTLTMYVRLFLADVFVHGIGGALYDQITDGMLEELFGVVPAYGCVSAAWLLPLGVAAGDGDLAGLRWRRHHVVHNPELGMDAFTARRGDVVELVAERGRLVAAIEESLRMARKDGGARVRRREWFERLQAVNRELHAKAPGVLGRLDEEIRAAEKAAVQNKVLQWREWFFGLHTREALEGLREAVCGK